MLDHPGEDTASQTAMMEAMFQAKKYVTKPLYIIIIILYSSMIGTTNSYYNKSVC